VRGVARLDFLWNESELYVNEINTIPGSLSKYLFVDPPVPFVTLLTDLIAEALDDQPTATAPPAPMVWSFARLVRSPPNWP